MKNKLIYGFVFLLLGNFSALQAQLTLKVTAIPVNTPANATIYGTCLEWWDHTDGGSHMGMVRWFV